MTTPLPILATLGLDQAARTGWGIGAMRDGLPPTVVRHGVARTADERRAVVELALEYAGGDPRQLLVMFERHDHISLDYRTAKDHRTKRERFVERGPKQIHGMGKAYGRWEERLNDVKHPERLRDEVGPETWRKRVLGTSRGSGEHLKHLARLWVAQSLRKQVDDPDECEGICITTFALVDGIARLEQRRIAARIDARGRRQQQRQLDLVTPPEEASR